MKIAFITSRFPFPVEKGDKLRAYQHIRWLGLRHEVHLFALTHDEIRKEDILALQEICAGVNIYRISKRPLILNLVIGWLNGLPASIAYFLDQKQRRLMQEDIIRLQPQHVFVQLIRAAEYVRVLPIAKTLDYMDVFSIGSSQRSKSGNVLLRPFFAMEARRLKKYEKAVYNDFTNHVIISEQDRDRLPLPYQGSVAVLSNGVDLNYFSPMADQGIEYDVVFVGNLGYVPNIQAAEFLVLKIMPLVWRRFPNVTVCLAGARPHKRVQKLVSERVVVTGWVSDIRPYYAKGRIFVAPIFSGMGQQNKILEAMAMERPCITTRLVDKAIGASAEQALLTAEDQDAFAQTLLHLLTHQEEATRLGLLARDFVSRNYSWELKNKMLERLLTKHTISSQTETVTI
jgi:sugar transferase (PEP-CTERM/EpsH1 system associated)